MSKSKEPTIAECDVERMVLDSDGAEHPIEHRGQPVWTSVRAIWNFQTEETNRIEMEIRNFQVKASRDTCNIYSDTSLVS